MQKVIFKFKIPAHGPIRMPVGAKILSVQKQQSHATVWALCDPDNGDEERFIAEVPTGFKMDFKDMKYIQTVQFVDSGLVWHYFEYFV